MGKSLKIKIALLFVGIIAIAGLVFGIIQRNNKVYRSVKIVEMLGDVTLEREGKGELTASVNMNLIPGDYVETGKDSYLVLLLDTDKYVMLEEQSRIQMNAYGNAEEGKTSIALIKGNVLNEIQNHLSDKDSYEIVTPNATMSVRGTVFEVRNDNNAGMIDVAVYDGAVGVAFEGQEESLVKEGEYTSFTDEPTPKIIVEKGDIADFPVSSLVEQRLLKIEKSGREIKIGSLEKKKNETKENHKKDSQNSKDSNQLKDSLDKKEENQVNEAAQTVTEVKAAPEQKINTEQVVAVAPTVEAPMAEVPTVETLPETAVTANASEQKTVSEDKKESTSSNSSKEPSKNSHSNAHSNAHKPNYGMSSWKYAGWYKKNDETHQMTLVTEEEKKEIDEKLYPGYKHNGQTYYPVIFVIKNVSKIDNESEPEINTNFVVDVENNQIVDNQESSENFQEPESIEENVIIGTLEYNIIMQAGSYLSSTFTPESLRELGGYAPAELNDGEVEKWYIDIVTMDEKGEIVTETKEWDFEKDTITDGTYLYAEIERPSNDDKSNNDGQPAGDEVETGNIVESQPKGTDAIPATEIPKATDIPTADTVQSSDDLDTEKAEQQPKTTGLDVKDTVTSNTTEGNSKSEGNNTTEGNSKSEGNNTTEGNSKSEGSSTTEGNSNTEESNSTGEHSTTDDSITE